MAYLHCHNCHWGQDDFWHEGYNPGTKAIEDYESYIKNPHRKVYMDYKWIQKAKIKWDKDDEGYYVMAKDLFVWSLERLARQVKDMDVPTNEEWKKVRKDWRCPGCGSQKWDID